MNRSLDWLHQAQADLAQAQLSADGGHHEWACFACHQAAEKALKALHLHLGQQVWGHGLGRLFRDLPDAVQGAWWPGSTNWCSGCGFLMGWTSRPVTPIAFQMAPLVITSGTCRARMPEPCRCAC